MFTCDWRCSKWRRGGSNPTPHLRKDQSPKFRNARRLKVTGRPCKACRERQGQERQQAEQEAAQLRQAEKTQQAKEAATATSGARMPLGWITERLPHGAKFEVVYDATQTRWSGTLTIEGKVFTDSSSGVFKLLRKLDRQFGESLTPSSAKAPSA